MQAMRCSGNKASPLVFLFLLCSAAILMFPSGGETPALQESAQSSLRHNPVPSPAALEPLVEGSPGGELPVTVVDAAAVGSAEGGSATTAPGSSAGASPGSGSDLGCMFDHVLLVVGFAHPASLEDVEHLKGLYAPYFPLMVIVGEVNAIHPPPSGVRVIQCNSNRGSHQYACVADALDAHPLFQGYLFIDARSIVFPWTLASSDRTRAWVPRWENYEIPDGESLHTRLDYELYDVHKCKLRHNIAVSHMYEGRKVAWAGSSDFLYIPAAYRKGFASKCHLFKTCHITHTVAFPSAMHQELAAQEALEVTVPGVQVKDRDTWVTELSDSTVWVPHVGSTEAATQAVTAAFAQHQGTSACKYNPYSP